MRLVRLKKWRARVVRDAREAACLWSTASPCTPHRFEFSAVFRAPPVAPLETPRLLVNSVTGSFALCVHPHVVVSRLQTNCTAGKLAVTMARGSIVQRRNGTTHVYQVLGGWYELPVHRPVNPNAHCGENRGGRGASCTDLMAVGSRSRTCTCLICDSGDAEGHR